jgi:hypothetical protein
MAGTSEPFSQEVLKLPDMLLVYAVVALACTMPKHSRMHGTNSLPSPSRPPPNSPCQPTLLSATFHTQTASWLPNQPCNHPPNPSPSPHLSP